MYGEILSEKELSELASTIGADVPFFLKGGLAVAEGIGDKLRFLDKKIEREIL